MRLRTPYAPSSRFSVQSVHREGMTLVTAAAGHVLPLDLKLATGVAPRNLVMIPAIVAVESVQCVPRRKNMIHAVAVAQR